MGWAAGLERMMLAAGERPAPRPVTDLFVADEDRGVEAFALASEARAAGLAVQQELAGRSLKGQLKQADRAGARYVAIVGADGIAAARHGLRRAGGRGVGGGRRRARHRGTARRMKHAPRPNTFRDAWAGDLTAARCGTEVRVAGWVHRRRDHGGLIFIDLRDRSGLVQLVVHPQASGDAFAVAEDLRSEHVVSAEGEIVKRAPENVNPNLATGEIEIHVRSLRRLAASETPPFAVDEDAPVDEMLRLQHRMLDLRREHMREAMELRHERRGHDARVLNERDFLEIETPILTRSTPEGARDFLVPSRLQPGSWYALPQSPQLFKQLLMMSGYERYYQIARCFRDEDLRADRQPEFTQLDVEMAFVDEDDVIETTEAVMSAVFAAASFAVPQTPWPRMRFDEAMLRFGSDRPDTALRPRDRRRLPGAARQRVQGLRVGPGRRRRGARAQRRRARDVALGARGAQRGRPAPRRQGGRVGLRRGRRDALADRQVPGRGPRGGGRRPAGRGRGRPAALRGRPAAGRGRGARRPAPGARAALRPDPRGRARRAVGRRLPDVRAQRRRLGAVHHPFTAPTRRLRRSGAMRSRAYDLIVDGWELGGGSIRINTPEVQEQVFKVIGMSEEEGRRRFGFLLDALKYGAPPHGGIALGLDRVVAMLAGRESIRDVIAFPKTSSGGDPLTGAPAPVDARQLRELGVRSIVDQA